MTGQFEIYLYDLQDDVVADLLSFLEIDIDSDEYLELENEPLFVIEN